MFVSLRILPGGGIALASVDPKGADFWGILTSLLGGAGWETWGGRLRWILLCILAIGFAAYALGSLLTAAAKALEAYKKSGLPVTLNQKQLAKVRRRRQFCNALKADLATLAKTENWNDQYFTDLEAEVEAEGGYYPTVLHRLFRHQSRGLRRVPSLMQAIESSTEHALLLVGEPGSGKSVALRHLAYEFAERGARSADPDGRIPLYVNLKELGAVPREGPNADFIKQFVLDNIRRGDADTVAYVRENWDDYRYRGIWFFLFDSFDEIPAVLHAPTGSPVIRQYAEAIRQFLEGVSDCRGVLASREFKGPDALPWQKLRILPLSEEKQDQLVENSFLEPLQKDIVRQHLAANRSTLGSNPLFLTLLCRYVKDENQPPANDLGLLRRHIERLASRDAEYTDRRYGLTSTDLIRGAMRLGVLFAEERSLSLAPTLDEIEVALNASDASTANLENLLYALVDVKILRSDVQESRPGDRRFTFSHRRYQETLFVRHLVENPTHLPADGLLTDLRWREYAVTLLQTQQSVAIKPLLDTAVQLLAPIRK